ncbi:ABC transporter permease [Pigmentiphaga kullae]|uniref:NitT/TauT family transport system permease protein/sulfonate transport system permease protein n=1 Tax=Pigmentiphaga kullae TaxID=151784 RepID=A0A4Q7NI67_9BURK|nr:ABC transporter permease [Pigmentiphaga kullae]RZS84576.1 NitT/TauT family transport system permease protein/sulfonate transport system permease protein [Pigmentiphaga kullae]
MSSIPSHLHAVPALPLADREPRPRKRVPAALLIVAGQVLLLAAILLSIQFLVDSGAVKPIYLASPTQVLEAFPRLVTQDGLLRHLLVTLSEALLGVAIAFVAGVSTGVVMGLLPAVHRFLNPFLVALMAVPKVAIIPLLTLYLGIGYAHKVFIVFLFGYFIFVFNTIAGIRQVQENHLKVARVLGATPAQRIFKVVLPSAIPSIMAAVRVEAVMCVVAALLAEIVASKAGIGNLLNRATGVYDTAAVFALVATITVFALLIIFAVEQLEKRVLLRWKHA